MISIPRAILRTYRSLVRRAGLHKSRSGPQPFLAIIADSDGCQIRAAAGEIAIEHRIVGEFAPESFLMPMSALDAWDIRGKDAINLEPRSDRSVLATWADRGVPRQAQFQVSAKAKVEFPEPPTSFAANDAQLWSALRDAVATSESGSTRFALECIQLRGAQGRIDATDGRHALAQVGFQFGFNDDVLVPAAPILGCRDLDIGEGVAVGRSGDWIGFGVGHWLVMLRINKDGRFPKLDDTIPNHEFARSQLDLSASDAEFLTKVIQGLPCEDPHYSPITLDLNGKVLIRSRDAQQPRPTEVELVSSQLSGDPIVLNTDRRYLERALRMGFRQAYIYGAASPILCRDEGRQFLWMLLDAASAIPHSDDAIHIESTPGSVSKPPSRIHSEPTMSGKDQTASSAEPQTKPVPRVKRTRSAASGGPIEQATALRDALRNSASAANQLVRLFKQQQRQNRLVESTLNSLKQLDKIAG